MDGITCNEQVTLVHHVKGLDTDTYECRIINGASWYEKVGVSVSSDGARPRNTFVSRIPEENLPEFIPEVSDFLVLGTVASVSRPSDLKGTKHFQIAAVSDNRRKASPHVKVSGS